MKLSTQKEDKLDPKKQAPKQSKLEHNTKDDPDFVADPMIRDN